MSTTAEKIAVMQAFDDGGEIEVSHKGDNIFGFIESPMWDWRTFIYRIKPKPMEIWGNIYGKKIIAYISEDAAINGCAIGGRTVKFIEVE